MTRGGYVGIGILMILIIGIAVFLLNYKVDTEPEVIYEPPSKEVLDNGRKKIEPETVEPGAAAIEQQSEPNGQRRPADTSDRSPETTTAAENNTGAEEVIPDDLAGIPHVRGFTSTNPMFAEGVPEHLQCPKQWVGLYSGELEDNMSEIQAHLMPIIYEILTKYNPERPLTEVWIAYIEAERFYKANADPELGNANGASGRFDWSHQQLLDFPEIMVLNNEDPRRSTDLRLVLLGHYPVDWNQYKLPDGRILYEGHEANYRVVTMVSILYPSWGIGARGAYTQMGHLRDIRLRKDRI